MLFKLVVSFLLAALSGMGVGGGGLFVIYLAVFTDTPQLIAQGMNLLFFLFSAGSSVIVHLSKRKIYPTLILLLAVSGTLGSIGGTFLTQIIDPSVLRKIFGIMLVITGLFSLMKGQGERDLLSFSRKRK